MIFRIRQEKRPVRFLLSRLLWKTRICRFFVIRRGSYSLYFSPSAVAALLWVEPDAGRAEEALLARFLQSGNVFVDVGANIGYLTMAAAVLVGEQGRVIAIEPHPRICQMLRENVALNRFSQVEVIQAALGSEVGRTAFTSNRSDDQNQIVSAGGVTVPLTRLDVILGESDGDIALLKIDVEGFEKFVLEGLGDWLPRTRAVLFESYETLYNHYGYSLDAIVSLFTRNGFVVGKIGQLGQFVPLPTGYSSVCCENLLALNEQKFSVRGWKALC